MFVVAYRVMHDIGFTPGPARPPVRRDATGRSAWVDLGWRVPASSWLMVEVAVAVGGVAIYAFYALQPYLLELYGDPQAYQVAGLVAAIVAGAQILGGVCSLQDAAADSTAGRQALIVIAVLAGRRSR